MDYKVSGSDNCGGSNHQSSSGSGIGCGGVVIAIVVFMLIYFVFNGASFEAIDTLLGLGFLAFIVAKTLFA